MLSPTPFPTIAPALLTGHAGIDMEHRLLLRIVEQLRQVCIEFDSDHQCKNCDGSKVRHCESFLIQTLGDLLMFLVDHFRNEEEIMKAHGLTSIDRDICELHKEDHAAISHTVQEIIVALRPAETARLVRKLHTLLTHWIENHIQVHDLVLVRMLTPLG